MSFADDSEPVYMTKLTTSKLLLSPKGDYSLATSQLLLVFVALNFYSFGIVQKFSHTRERRGKKGFCECSKNTS